VTVTAPHAPAIAVLPAGDRALLLEPTDRTAMSALAATLHRLQVPGVCDILPAARTVLITIKAGIDLDSVRRYLHTELSHLTPCANLESESDETVQIPVTYNGADLVDVATVLGMSVEDVVAEHCRHRWRCAFVGFAPGFGYLESDASRLAVPRRDESRTAVPAGAVALADGYSAIYPRRSPGGWQLIGHTSVNLWDLDAAQPALISAGTWVQFYAESL
jgi:KipI family sensor histidine kinase inhibitor